MTYTTNISHIEDQARIKSCLIYARVSTDRQVREGHSLDDQVDRLVKYAREHNWRILEIYKDGGKSGGSTTGRPEFTRMLERCEKDKDVDIVLLEETDRFARDAQDHLAVKSFLKKHSVELIATQQPNFGDDPVGKFVDLVMAGANQLQREITGQKTKRTMVALAEKGFQPGVAVIGYLNSYKKGVAWKIDKERVYFIKEIFRRFHTGNHSIYSLEEEMYQEGFRTKNGKRVSSSNIHRILTDVRYAGKVLYCGKMYDGKHKSIVTMEDIEKSKAILAKHNKGADRSRKHNWFLAGLVFCDECGTLMSGEQHVKPDGRVFKYYRCLGSRKGKVCKQSYAPMDKVHKQLEKFMANIKFDERFFKGLRTELEEVMKEQGDDIPSRTKALKDRKAVIEKKMDKLEDQMIAEVMPQDRIEKKYLPLKDELKSVEADIAKLSKPSANLDDKKIDTIIKFLKQLPKLYKAFNKKEKKQFLRWFACKIWIKDKEVVNVTYTDAFKVLENLRLVRISDTWLALTDYVGNYYREFLMSNNYTPTFAN